MGNLGEQVNKKAWATEPIAVIGISSKFAGEATNTEKLWSMISEGRSGWTPFPDSRFKAEGVYHPNNERLNTTHVKGAHFLEEDVSLFDAAFFSYSSETAASLDPQYRLQLESVYEALENAGLPISQVSGSNTSVFTGVFVHDYRDGLLRDADNLPRLMATGTGVPMMANRVSHFFDFRGASMTIETACSSGMVAMHQGIQSLRTGEADMSVVGGANLTLNPDMFKALASSGFLSGDGKSYAFDSRASGYGRGEGVATIIIKRLQDALDAGDPIRAVIRESMLNQDGKTETITTPSLEAQQALIRNCYRKAGLDPRDTQYFEAHGTGTQAGDTVEARAIATVFATDRKDREPLLFGSIKTNLGHTEAASGLASVVKTVLALERGLIPPSINFEKPNPKLALDEWNLKLVRKLEKWPPGLVRRASINNFGYGGANAHLIIEDATSWIPKQSPARNMRQTEDSDQVDKSTRTDPTEKPPANSQVLVLSGKDEQACQKTVSNLADFLDQRASSGPDNTAYLQSLVYTLGQRRTRFPWAAAYPIPISEGLGTVVQALRSPKFKPSRSSRKPRIGMVFTGQGAQWYAMGRELVESYPVYQASLQIADGYLKEFGAGWSLMEELSRDAEDSRVNEVGLGTPICVAVQIALVNLLRDWGVTPAAITSHSSGEIAAGYAVGALSFRAALAFSYHRAVLAADKTLRGPVRGGMIAMGVGLKETEPYISRLNADGKAVVACINSPSSITVAGDLSAILELETLATADGVFARRLKVDTAWHSHHMAPIAEAYAEALESLDDKKCGEIPQRSISFSSPVTGGRVDDLERIASPHHWVNSLLQPVQFVKAFTDMVVGNTDNVASNVDVVVEVGPHTALGGPIQQILALPEFKNVQVPYYGSLVRKTSALESMQTLAANLLQEGFPVNMGAVNFPPGKGSDVKIMTDLPSYPWNHQVKHWVEPRFNKALRERSQPPHDILGSLVEGANPETPSWRHILRVSESPWTRDHAIQSNIVYPAAGYVSLAIEAIKQQMLIKDTNTFRDIAAYRLRDIEFLQALMIPDTSDGIEIQTSLRPVSSKDIALRDWKQFEVWTVTSDNRWTQHAKGFITVEYQDGESFPPTELGDTRSEIEGYTRRILPSDLFTNLRALGISHGPMFQNIYSIVQSGSAPRSIVTLIIADTTIPNDLPRDHVLHPVTLDSIITSPYSAVPRAAAHEIAAKVPRSVADLWVSSKISNEAGHLLKADSLITRDDSNGMAADVLVSNSENDQVVLKMLDFTYQSLGRSVSTKQENPWELQIYNRLNWSLDIIHKSPATLAYVNKQMSLVQSSWSEEATRSIWRLCVYHIRTALEKLQKQSLPYNALPHHAKYHAWMKNVIEQAASNELSENSAQWLNDTETDIRLRARDVSANSSFGKIVSRLGPLIPGILTSETQVTDHIPEVYHDDSKAKQAGARLATLLQHLVYKNPRARILEVGAGVSDITRSGLNALWKPGTEHPSASLYHYTNIAAENVKLAQEELASRSDIIAFDTLDIERDVITQGFSTASYDIVIASHIAPTVNDVSGALKNVKQLLKREGTLLVVEDDPDQIGVHFVNGLLPAWWITEATDRQSSPLLSRASWDEAIRQAGFEGIEIEYPSEPGDVRFASSIIMTTAQKQTSVERSLDLANSVIVTSAKTDQPPSSWLNSLQKSISSIAGNDARALPAVRDLESKPSNPSLYTRKVCIFIGEINDPILYDLNEDSLNGIRAMSAGSKGLLWITRGGAVDCERPELSLAQGFVRALRNEYVGRKLATLDLDPKDDLWSDVSISAIVDVLRHVFGKDEGGVVSEKGPAELEFAEREGMLFVPRLHHDHAMNENMPSSFSKFGFEDATKYESFRQPGRPLSWNPTSAAFDDDMYTQTVLQELPPASIEVEPRAYGVTARTSENQVTGLECAGIIAQVGNEAATQGYAVGDRVICLLSQSSFASRAMVDWTSTVKIPDELSFEEAASIPSAFLAAYFSLTEIANLRPHHSILIHAAAGEVGQAAVMIAQHLGARIFVTIGSSEERELADQNFKIPSDHVLDNRNLSYAATVKKLTDGRGVDVVLNSLDGPHLLESLKLVAPFGHFVEIGNRDLELNNNLGLGPFMQSITFSSFNLSELLKHRRHDVHRCLKEVATLFASRAVTPVHPINKHSITEIGEVTRILQIKPHLGKTVLSVDGEEKVQVLPAKTTVKLPANASYLIVGGNGGLGQSVAHWLVSQGARHIILLSRSAGTSKKTSAFAEELRKAGCHRVLPLSCDVADEDDLASAIDQCLQEGLPPIRGVIHAAFVLKDSIVEKMTLDDYKHTTSSKVAGAWNLHNQFSLPGDLDFFVLFSSINGILGYASQAAYSAAGAYEDALAHWRVKQCGLPGVSIDLSLVNTVGYVAEADAAEALRKSLVKAGRRVIDEDHVLASLKWAILNPYDAQFIVGGVNSGPGSHWDVDGDLGRDMRLLSLKYHEPSASAQDQQNQDAVDSLASRISASASRRDAVHVVGSAMAEMLADMFLVPVEDIDLAQSPSQQGVDSLVAVEVRNMLFSQAGAELSIFNIMQSPSLSELAVEVVDRSAFASFSDA